MIVVNETPIRLTAQAKQFIHINPGSLDAFALAMADKADGGLAEKLGVESSEIDDLLKTIGETEGDLLIMFGGDLSPDAQAALAGSAANFASDGRRVLLHPLPLYNNSVGANDMMPGKKIVGRSDKKLEGAYIAGSLRDANALQGKDFVVVQELFETETTAFADVVFPAASFAEVDGTFTNNSGFVQRVRQAIEPLNQSKARLDDNYADRARDGCGFRLQLFGARRFPRDGGRRSGLRGLALPAAERRIESRAGKTCALEREGYFSKKIEVEAAGRCAAGWAEKNTETPKIGHKLHRITTMTGKTAQFHLLAHGNPKPDNLLVAPLVAVRIGRDAEKW